MAHELRVFVKVVDRGSFSAAATDLGLTPSAVSKLVSRLEDRLGVGLLHRTTRRLSLTADGERFCSRARDILAAIDDAEAEVSQSGRSPRGRLRVNCVTGFAFHALSRHLPAFMAQYPDIQLELAVTDRIVDLLAAHADVAIRSGVIADPALVTRRFAQFERLLYASPGYLARRGTPRTPGELAQHDCIVLAGQQPARWPLLVDGHITEVEVNSRLVVDNAEAALRVTMAGGGIARITNMHAAQAQREGTVVPVLAAFQLRQAIPLSAVYPEGRHRMPKVRVFLDFLAERFAQPDWNLR